jgi:kinesin family protein 6/9
VIDVTISYLEIYAGAGYDLLVAENRSRNLSDLPRVSAMATANG